MGREDLRRGKMDRRKGERQKREVYKEQHHIDFKFYFASCMVFR